MPDNMDYLLRPVIRGMIRYDSLKDCTINLYDISVMHDALDVVTENERRHQEATKP